MSDLSKITTNPDRFYDVIIIGGGPAGLTGAIYLARACYRVLVIEKEGFGGQITITSEVVNYPGIPLTNGKELTEGMRKQAESFGAEFLHAEVLALDTDGDIRTIQTSVGTYECYGILLATGAHPRTVGFDGELEWRGHGVAYCATCDGEFFTGKKVFVIGGGFAAAEESVFLTRYASDVMILIRGDDFTCAKSAADAARANPKITVLTNTTVDSVSGDSGLNEIRYRNSKTGEVTQYKAEDGDFFGVFVFAGYTPATELVRDKVELNPQGYIITDRTQKTSLDGVYAAGDVCMKNLRQVVTAVGDGATAATELEKYARGMAEKTGFKPKPPVRATKQPVADGAGKAQKKNPAATGGAATARGALFSDDINAQLDTVFGRMTNSLILKVYSDGGKVSSELAAYMEAMAERTQKLSVEKVADAAKAPCVEVCKADGTWTGLSFHGVPGGHEFTSFVLGLYNTAGPGQPIDPSVLQRIRSIDEKKDITIMVSLTCTMCPELVTSAQRIAAENPLVTAEVYDLNHFPDMKELYNVMSVPCFVVNGGKPMFGKKSIPQLLDLLQ